MNTSVGREAPMSKIGVFAEPVPGVSIGVGVTVDWMTLLGAADAQLEDTDDVPALDLESAPDPWSLPDPWSIPMYDAATGMSVEVDSPVLGTPTVSTPTVPFGRMRM